MTRWVVYRSTPANFPNAVQDGIGFGTLDGDWVQPHQGDIFEAPVPMGQALALASLDLLSPVRPRQFIGLWNNFHAAAAKGGHAIPDFPLYFLKAPSSIIGPDGKIESPPGYTGRLLYEGELGIVIGPAQSIFGYTIVNDVTALDLLQLDPSFPQWARAKSAASFGPVGPCIVTDIDLNLARVRVALNGRVRQDYPLSDMIFPPARIIERIGSELTLLPGDVIACGTSIGALPMRAGMVVEVSIDGIGTLRNVVAGAE
ncbi:MAG: fumarylacetoacetate hydrolase family protein [Rubritepida sp.]|nr:fumarylacetoacetate hydrolase family protein [Rubritepida sp.]